MTKQGQRLKHRRIALGITGSIAAYKAVELLRMLQNEGADVRVLIDHIHVRRGIVSDRVDQIPKIVMKIGHADRERRIQHPDRRRIQRLPGLAENLSACRSPAAA